MLHSLVKVSQNICFHLQNICVLSQNDCVCTETLRLFVKHLFRLPKYVFSHKTIAFTRKLCVCSQNICFYMLNCSVLSKNHCVHPKTLRSVHSQNICFCLKISYVFSQNVCVPLRILPAEVRKFSFSTHLLWIISSQKSIYLRENAKALNYNFSSHLIITFLHHHCVPLLAP